MPTRLHLRRNRREVGSSVVEMAIMAPILTVMVFWLIYFWEMQQGRLKAAEAARYLAFNQTVGATNDVVARFEDLDSTTPTGKLGKARFNTVKISQAAASLVKSPMSDGRSNSKPPGLSGMASTIFGAVSGALGTASDGIMSFLGMSLDDGRVQTNVQIDMKNMLIPKRVGDYISGESGAEKLDLSFKDSMTMDYKTFAAVDLSVWNGLPAYDHVSDLTTASVKKMAYLTVYSRFSGTFDFLGTVLAMFGIWDWPFSGDYISDSTRLQDPYSNTRYGVTVNDNGKQQTGHVRTAPGDKYYAFYFTGSADHWCSSVQGRACEPSQIQDLRKSKNPDYRAYQCRGDYYLGTTKSKYSEVDYASNSHTVFNYSSSGCQ